MLSAAFKGVKHHEAKGIQTQGIRIKANNAIDGWVEGFDAGNEGRDNIVTGGNTREQCVVNAVNGGLPAVEGFRFDS